MLDTSVWINLLATEAIDAIIRALELPCFAPEQVFAEVKRHPVTGAVFSPDDHPLRQSLPNVAIVSLEGLELDLFLDVVSASAGDALGDGEAAAIVVAACRGMDLIIDDRKARRILRERFSHVRTYWTVDVLRADFVVQALGVQRADQCFMKAQRFGRMHIQRSH